MNEEKNYKTLLENFGYVVIPFTNTSKDLSDLQEKYYITLKNFTEYVNNELCLTEGFVLGGFSALANPGSFHNEFVRKLRQWCMSHLIDTLFVKYKGYNLEQIIDRMMYRPPGFKPSAETWHRDESPKALDGDKIFGGWVNLDNHDQFFSAVPKTHKEVGGQHKGFASIKDTKMIKEYKTKKSKIRIPPGHILVFYENIVHEVLSNAVKDRPIKRVFLSWRLTKSKKPYFKYIATLLTNKQVMPLKSGQTPPMYARLHWTNWRKKIELFSKNIINQFKETKILKSGKNKGKKYNIVQQHLRNKPLEGDTTLKPYTINELRMHYPNTEWNLLVPFNKRISRKISI